MIGQQLHQYKQNKRKFKQWLVNNYTNINKTKESLNSDGQQLHQYKQNKRKFKQWLVNNYTNINKTKESLNSDWSTITPI